MLKAQYTSKFERDVKALAKRHCDIALSANGITRRIVPARLTKRQSPLIA